jgi:hypothetical protein
VDDSWELAIRCKVRGREDADGVAGLVGGVNRTLDVKSLRQLDGLADFGCDYPSKNIVNRRKTSLHRGWKVAREKEAKWESMFTCAKPLAQASRWETRLVRAYLVAKLLGLAENSRSSNPYIASNTLGSACGRASFASLPKLASS